MKKQTQYTPGPWAYGKPYIRGTCEFDIFRAYEGQDHVCTCNVDSTFERAKEINEVNARLIAAAPELYEALRELEQAFEFLSGKGWGSEVDKARAALAKVSGSADVIPQDDPNCSW